MNQTEQDRPEPVPLVRLQESNPARWGRPPVAAWQCAAHGRVTTGDCLKCDDELIGLLEESLPKCHACGRAFRDGEEVWADDWTVVEPTGVHTETRYICDACTGEPAPSEVSS